MKNKKNLLIFNTLGRKLQEFTPINDKCVGMYTCGPTVYGRAHIGNMRAYIFADVIKRTLLYYGYDVKHVMNITDVGHLTSDSDEGEDKLAKAARESKTSAWTISKQWTEQFFKDTASLNVLPVTIPCKATDHIEEQIKLIKSLEAKGYTYITEDGVYYDTSKFPRYTEFAKIDVEGLQAGKRIDMAEKRNKTDFALWKFSKPNEKRDMEWTSPWGTGFPGWHVECSAMSMKYLGETFDIHTGGIDHIPIHHTNEIAQSEASTGKKFVNYWMHCDFLTMSNSEKMSKSLGNVVNIDTLRANNIEPLAFRYMCLSAHYRTQLLYSKEILKSATVAYSKLKAIIADLKAKVENEIIPDKTQWSAKAQQYLGKFEDCIFNDFNTPQALANMWMLTKDINISSAEKLTLLLEFDKVFGLSLDQVHKEEVEELPENIKYLLMQRQQFRKNKQWEQADSIREQVLQLGYCIIDTKDGVEAKKIES